MNFYFILLKFFCFVRWTRSELHAALRLFENSHRFAWPSLDIVKRHSWRVLNSDNRISGQSSRTPNHRPLRMLFLLVTVAHWSLITSFELSLLSKRQKPQASTSTFQRRVALTSSAHSDDIIMNNGYCTKGKVVYEKQCSLKLNSKGGIFTEQNPRSVCLLWC